MERQKNNIKNNIKLATGIILGYMVLPAVIYLGYNLTHGNISGLRLCKLEVECSNADTNWQAEVESPAYSRDSSR